ncbi:MAG: NAD(P)-dependent oxidoreductase [Verrucomicrobiales bacterium]|nr:NAD(P)-dependent oxidoreductase [Verrucomicrobiales bacterium]
MNNTFIVSVTDRILVTGSNGFIGAQVVKTLLEYGFANLRCFVRPSSKLETLKSVLGRCYGQREVEFVTGDLQYREDCRKAVEGASVVIHLAAGFEKSYAGAFMNSALATRNLLDAVLEDGQVKRFVNVSSFAVYSNLGLRRGALLEESCPLEDLPQERNDAYGFGKLKQERLVREYGDKYALPYVILRPGAVFGPGNKAVSGRVGIETFGFFLHLGGSNELPLTYVDNCAEAIVLAGLKQGVDGEVLNVVDDDLLTSRQFFRAYKKAVRPRFSLGLPYAITFVFCAAWEWYSKWSKCQLPPAFNRRRCSAEWKGNRYTNRKLKAKLGWTPRVPMNRAMELFLEQFKSRST